MHASFTMHFVARLVPWEMANNISVSLENQRLNKNRFHNPLT